MNNTIKAFSASDVQKALPMKEAIECMKEAFIQLSDNKAIIPPRIHLGIPEHNGDTLIMPIYMPDKKKIGLKLITLFNDNKEHNLPLIHALVIVVDATNGQPKAIMDGGYLTALRTGAGSGLATKLLARDDAKVLTVFGSGAQGKTQLEAVCSVRKIDQIFIFDVNKLKAQKFISEIKQHLDIPISFLEKPRDLIDADIICTATNSTTPVFHDKHVREGAHINAIGSYKPQIREIPSETIARAKIIVDHKASCLSEAGDLLIPMQEKLITEKHIFAELGEILSNKKQLPKRNAKDITLFKSVGSAIQDLVTANQILLKGIELQLGSDILL